MTRSDVCDSRFSSSSGIQVPCGHSCRFDDTWLGHFFLDAGLYRVIEFFFVILMSHARIMTW